MGKVFSKGQGQQDEVAYFCSEVQAEVIEVTSTKTSEKVNENQDVVIQTPVYVELYSNWEQCVKVVIMKKKWNATTLTRQGSSISL